MTDAPGTEYVSSDQIADELGVHPQTVQRYFREHGLPGRKIGKSWRTTRTALNEWLTGGPPATAAAGLAGIERPTGLPDLETKA